MRRLQGPALHFFDPALQFGPSVYLFARVVEEDMPYRIRFKGSETTALRAHTPHDALVIAQRLAEEGKEGICVSLGDGEAIMLRQFADLVRDGLTLPG